MADLKVYTVEDIMQALNISKQTIYTYIRLGEIKAIKLGGKYRITEQAFNDFMTNGLSPEYYTKLKAYMHRD